MSDTDTANRRTINGESEAARRFAEYCVEAVRQYTPDDSGIGLHKMIGMNFELAVRDAVDAERAKWVAACWEAHNDGYNDQGWTVLYEMGATDEVPK